MQKLKSKAKIILTVFSIAFISINCNFNSIKEENNNSGIIPVQRNKCKNLYFTNMGINKNFTVDSTQCLEVFDKCFCFSRIKGNKETINAYLSLKNDSIFLIRAKDLKFNKPNLTLLLSLNWNKGYYNEYYDYNQLRDTFSLIGNFIAVEVIEKKITMNDTTYFFYHSSLPNITEGPFPEKRRYFTFSTKYGFLDYYEENIGNTEKLKFSW